MQPALHLVAEFDGEDRLADDLGDRLDRRGQLAFSAARAYGADGVRVGDVDLHVAIDVGSPADRLLRDADELVACRLRPIDAITRYRRRRGLPLEADRTRRGYDPQSAGCLRRRRWRHRNGREGRIAAAVFGGQHERIILPPGGSLGIDIGGYRRARQKRALIRCEVLLARPMQLRLEPDRPGRALPGQMDHALLVQIHLQRRRHVGQGRRDEVPARTGDDLCPGHVDPGRRQGARPGSANDPQHGLIV